METIEIIPYESGYAIDMRLPHDVWSAMARAGRVWKMTADDLEDQDYFNEPPGWRYNAAALKALLKYGYAVSIYGKTASTEQEFDALFSREGMRAAREEHDAPIKQRLARINQINNEFANIKYKFQKTGEKPAGINRPEGERHMDSMNIYGGGDCFIIGAKYIWYVKNNGMDGDDWFMNNVATGGAGAIGYRVPYDESLAQKIISLEREYQELKKQV